MQVTGHGINFEAPLSWDKDILVGFAFVDDTNIAEVDLTRTEITIEDVYIIMQKTIKRWKGGLKSNGGAIIPDRSFVYPIYFKCEYQGYYSFYNPEDHVMELTVNQTIGEI